MEGFYLCEMGNSNPIKVVLVESTEDPRETALKKTLGEIPGGTIIKLGLPGDFEKVIVRDTPNIGRLPNSGQALFVKQFFFLKKANLIV